MRLAGLAWIAAALCLGAAGARGAVQTAAASPLASSAPNTASLEDYRAHLLALSTTVEACAKARDMKSCDPALAGADDEVPVSSAPNAERRLVRYGWLRVLLAKARDKDAPPPKARPASGSDHPQWDNVRPTPPTTTQLLADAKTRLARDLARIDSPALPLPDHARERAVMNEVLSGRDFRGLVAESPKDTTMEKVGNWLNRVIESAVKASARAPWLGKALVWGFIGAVCVGLVWGLLQLERRWRVRLVPEERTPAPGAASAIPWQLWMEDARRAAAAGAWREAIHFLYWAAISRLESKRLWPADRARTPREYLALVGADDPRRAGLTSLTGSFERVWYGGRAAAESDYKRAEEIATALIQGPGAGGTAQ